MSYIGNQPSQVAFLTDTFSGTGSATAFTMSVAPANPASILVAISGVLQAPSVYSVSGTTLTFSSAPASGTGNISVRYLGIPASGVTSTAYRTVTEFTATSGQTTFTPPSYTVGFINVYQNGARLAAADYTATNGTTVVLNTGATTNDLVTVESFLVSSVLNAIPATAGSVQSSYLAPQSSIPFVDGTVQTTASTSGATGYFRNLKLSTTGTSAAVTVTADALVLGNGSNSYINVSSINLSSLNTGNASGVANSLDTGSWAYSTWYYVFVISNGTTTAGLFSLSATAPTLPSGYTYFARVGAIRTQSATNYYPLSIIQYNRRVQYKVVSGSNVTAMPAMASGSAGTVGVPVTLVAVSISSFVPPTASQVRCSLAMNSQNNVQLASNNAKGTSSSNPVDLWNEFGGSGGVVTTDMDIESTNIYWASNSSSGYLCCSGWEDNL